MDDWSGVRVDKNGKTIRIKKIPPRGKAKSLFKKSKYDNSVSPFERFSDTNGTKAKHTSF